MAVKRTLTICYDLRKKNDCFSLAEQSQQHVNTLF